MTEDGIPEEDATARLGTPERLAAAVIAETGDKPGATAPAPPRPAGGATAAEDGRSEFAEIDSLDIQWTGGEIEILPYDGASVAVTETAGRPLRDNEKMAVTCENGVLMIKYCRGTAGLRMLSKRLRIELPGMAAVTLKSLRVDTVSAQTAVNGIKADNFYFRSVSGDLSAAETQFGRAQIGTVSGDVAVRSEYRRLSVETTSGDISVTGSTASETVLKSISGDITAAGETEHLTAKTTSGDISMRAENSGEISAAAASGDILFSGTAETMRLRSYSGDIRALAQGCPREAELETASGDIELGLPADSAFALKTRTVTGDITNDFTVMPGLDTAGDAAIKITTAAGDISLKKNR